jgi:hypothetical protein
MLLTPRPGHTSPEDNAAAFPDSLASHEEILGAEMKSTVTPDSSFKRWASAF